MSVALDVGFPGAGRVVRELVNISNGKVKLGADWHGADFLFLPAWQPAYEAVNHPRKVIVWTSSIIQSEYTPVEFEYMQRIVNLLDNEKIYALWVGSKDWLPVIGRGSRRVFYCPYPVTIPQNYKTFKGSDPPRDVSLFGPLPPRKNVVVQAFSAAGAGCVLHTTDKTADSLLITLGLSVPFVSHNWQIPARYHDLVISVDVGLQCSVPGAETFSYVAWDHVSRDVPCLSTAPWMPAVSGALYVRPENAFEVEYLTEHIKYAANMFEMGQLRALAQGFALERNKTVKDTLKAELGLDL